MKTRTVSIDTLSFGGRGVGRVDGKVCFVPFSCPGDSLRVRVSVERRSYFEADIEEVLEASPLRAKPFCRHFGVCGGCSWQHVAQDTQLAAKRSILAGQLWRGARVESENVLMTVASPQWTGYRSRVQLKLHYDGKMLHMGFFRQGSHYVIDLSDGCPLVHPEINELLYRLRALLSGFSEPECLPQITIEHGENGICAIFHYIGRDSGAFEAFLESGASVLAVGGILVQQGRKSSLKRVAGDSKIRYRVTDSPESRPRSLVYTAGGFSQVNRLQNIRLIEQVRRMCAPMKGSGLLDIYCGNGNLSLPLAGEFAGITGIEDSMLSIDAAAENAREACVRESAFVCGDAAETLSGFVAEGRRFPLVLIDPPRAGAKAVAGLLDSAGAERVIYVSCDPATLARDCGILRGAGFKVQESVPLDMFPHTYHIESVTVLVR